MGGMLATVCTPDKKGMLKCEKHKWTFVQACLGERGCALESKRVTCDNSVAQVGDVCREEEHYACSGDKKAALVCRSNKFVQVNLCKGPKGCRITGDKTPGYVREMIRIEHVLPEARFIHLIRDGRDVALSVLARDWGPDTVEGAARRWKTTSITSSTP